MTDVEKFDLFNRSYSWIYYKPFGSGYSEYKCADTLQCAFARVFNFLNY